jgi:Phage tail protein
MPLLAGSLVAPPTPEVVTGPTEAYFESAGNSYFTWIDPDGVQWPLSDISEGRGWHILWPSGLGAAPIEFATDSLPNGGEAVRFIQEKSSTLQVPVVIFGTRHQQFVDRYRRLSRAFKLTTRRKRPGRLVCQRPDGTMREAHCYYSEGLAGEPDQGHLNAKPVITLYCPEGKWRSVEPVVVTRTFTSDATDPDDPGGSSGTGNFFSPFLNLTSSRQVGSGAPAQPVDPDSPDSGNDPDGSGSLTTITNPGDVEAWPVWTITGPMTQLRTWNQTLDTRFALTYELTELQTITITTGDYSTVRGPGDANLSKAIDWFNPAGTELWPLADGPNIVGLEVDGAGATTSVKLSFTPRYDNS